MLKLVHKLFEKVNRVDVETTDGLYKTIVTACHGEANEAGGAKKLVYTKNLDTAATMF